MRVFVTVLIAAFALASSAFAGNIALTPATATCGGTPLPCFLTFPFPAGTQYLASNTIDGNSATEWVAPGGTVNPYVLIDLLAPHTVDNVDVFGVGNSGRFIGFSVFVGMSSDLTTLRSSTAIGTVANQPGGTAWSDLFSVSTSSQIRYVLYDVTISNTGSADAIHDDAYATTISVDGVPEPGTFGLLGAGLLALGFSRRSRK